MNKKTKKTEVAHQYFPISLIFSCLSQTVYHNECFRERMQQEDKRLIVKYNL